MKIQSALALIFFTLVPVAASAQTQDEQSACIGDAFNICGHAISGSRPGRGLSGAKYQPHFGSLPDGDAALLQVDDRNAREAVGA